MKTLKRFFNGILDFFKKMKIILTIIVTVIAFIIAFAVWFAASLSAAESINLSIPQHISGYCGGQFPPIQGSTDKLIAMNDIAINKCIVYQNEWSDKIDKLWIKNKGWIRELQQMIFVCMTKSYDPHFMNMLKIHTCFSEAIINKKMM